MGHSVSGTVQNIVGTHYLVKHPTSLSGRNYYYYPRISEPTSHCPPKFWALWNCLSVIGKCPHALSIFSKEVLHLFSLRSGCLLRTPFPATLLMEVHVPPELVSTADSESLRLILLQKLRVL